MSMYIDDFDFKASSSASTGLKKRKKWHQRWWGRLIIIFLTIFLIILTAVVFYLVKTINLIQRGEITPQQLFGQNQSGLARQNLSVQNTSDDPHLGPTDAKVVMVEFSDFQCPFCKEALPVIKEVLKDYGDKILFIYRDFPLTDTHPQALLAALAAQCAHEQGKFWPMHDLIFDNQNNLTEASLKTFAVQIGLSSIQFGSCLQSQKYLAEVEQDLKDGYDAGVRATPTVFINGILIRGAQPLATYEKIIIAELSR